MSWIFAYCFSCALKERMKKKKNYWEIHFETEIVVFDSMNNAKSWNQRKKWVFFHYYYYYRWRERDVSQTCAPDELADIVVQSI